VPRRLRSVVVPLAAVALLAVSGCGGGPKLVKISGTVKYNDGTPVPGNEVGYAVIAFVPEVSGKDPETGEIRKGATGPIQANGRFAMTTFRPEDGVIPGKYKVVICVAKDNADPESHLIAEKYFSKGTTDLEQTVDKAASDLEFKVEKIR
jgi:hypothetical protein